VVQTWNTDDTDYAVHHGFLIFLTYSFMPHWNFTF